MKEYPNFYQDIAEAVKRLTSTVVKFEDDFYYVLCVSDHKGDGIFRIYLDPLKDMWSRRYSDLPFLGGTSPGVALDEYIKNNKGCTIVRKYMSAAGFNKYRPFPLGMVNEDGIVVYTERCPTRHTQQGLTSDMVVGRRIRLDTGRSTGNWNVERFSRGFYRTLIGEYPTFKECCDSLLDKSVINDAAAFHREFCVIKGPANSLFLGYKTSVIGILDGTSVRLSSEYGYLLEIVQDLNVFDNVTITE